MTVAAAPSRLIGTPATRWTGWGGSSTAVPGTSGATKNGAQYATGTAAAKNRTLARSPAPDQIDQMLAADNEAAIASAVTPWNRAWAGQRSLKICESFQSAASGAATVIMLAKVRRLRPAIPLAAAATGRLICTLRSAGRSHPRYSPPQPCKMAARTSFWLASQLLIRSRACPRTHGLPVHERACHPGERPVIGAAQDGTLPGVTALPVFDFAAFFAAFDTQRRDRGLGWYEFADELWQRSSELNAQRRDHPLCGGAVSRLGARGATSCQYALFMLRWLGRAPEEFLTGPVVDVGDVQLPEPGPGSRLRWNLYQLHTALNEQRQERGLTWSELAQELGCTPSRLTNLRTARMADLSLTMRVTQWLGKPAAEFIHAAYW